MSMATLTFTDISILFSTLLAVMLVINQMAGGVNGHLVFGMFVSTITPMFDMVNLPVFYSVNLLVAEPTDVPVPSENPCAAQPPRADVCAAPAKT